MANELKYDVKVTGAQPAAQQVDQIAKATDNAAKSTGQFNRVFVDQKNAADSASSALENVAAKGGAAKDIVEGLSTAARGGDTAFFGLAKSARGLFNIFKSGAGFIGGAALGLTAAKAALDSWVQSSENALEAARNFTSQNERIAASLKQIEDAAKTSLAEQKQQVSELTEAYATLNGQIDAAAQRVDKLNNAQTRLKLAQLDQQEAEALSKSSPDEGLRDSIRRDFNRRREDVRATAEDTRITNAVLGTQTEEKAANEALRGFREQLEAATTATKQAENDLAGARANASVVTSETVNSEFGRSLRDAVKVAEEALKATRANEAALRDQLQPQIDQASRRVQNARDTRTQLGVERETLTTENATRETTRSNEDIDLKRKQEQERQKKLADQLKGQTASVESSPGIEGEPLKQAVEEQAQTVAEKFETSNAGIAATAQAITAATANIPPAADFAGVGAAFAQYHQAVVAQFTSLQQQVNELKRNIQLAAMQAQNNRPS